jgi:plasmid maintenance system antidote protein VapI
MVDEDGKAVVEIEKEDNYASSDKFRVRLKLPLQNKIIATNTNTDDNEDARGGKLLRKKTRKTANKTKVIGEDKNDDVPVTKAQARVKATQKEKVRSTHDEDLNNHKNPLRKKKSPKSKKLGENHAIKKRKRSAASSSAEQPPKKAKMLSKEERVEQRINFLNDYLSEHDMSKYVLAKAIGIGTSSIVKLFDKSAVIGPRVAEKLAVYFKKDRGFFCVGKETETLAIEEEGGTSYKGADFIKQHLIKHGLRKSEFLKNLGYMFGNGYLGRILKGESQISERFAKVLGKYFDCSYKDFIREEDFSNEKKKEKRLSSKKDMEYVEAHRKSIPMTKTDFSKELGMTIQHYSLISTGDREVTRPTAKKLAVYFKCDVDDFMPAYDVASSTKTGVDFLKDYMKKTRIKQPELSSKIGITQAQLNAIVLGQNPITKMMAIRFAQYFECSTHVFLED